MDVQIVAFDVLEPRRFLGTQNADVVDDLQAGEIVVFEDHAGTVEPIHACRDIGHLKADLGVIGLGAGLFRKQGDQRAATLIDELPVRVQGAGVQTEFSSQNDRARRMSITGNIVVTGALASMTLLIRAGVSRVRFVDRRARHAQR